MKLEKALEIIGEKGKDYMTSEKGYMVSFEVRGGGVLRSDHFPDKHAGEPLISTESEAWELSEKFAKSTGDNYLNIYVIGDNFCPVKGYSNKKFKSY